jgi:hypothetical protein
MNRRFCFRVDASVSAGDPQTLARDEKEASCRARIALLLFACESDSDGWRGAA